MKTQKFCKTDLNEKPIVDDFKLTKTPLGTIRFSPPFDAPLLSVGVVEGAWSGELTSGVLRNHCSSHWGHKGIW